MPVVVVIGRLLLLCRFAGCNKRGLFRGVGQTGIREPDLNALRGGPVEVPERQRKLDRKRKQRQPRAVLEVFPEPVHDELRLPRTAKVALAAQCYIITSEGHDDVNRSAGGHQ